MKITLETSPEQDDLLTNLNALSNPDGKTTLDDFTLSYIDDWLNNQIAKKQQDIIAGSVETLKTLSPASVQVVLDAIAVEAAKK